MAAEPLPTVPEPPAELSLEELERRAEELSQRRLAEQHQQLEKEISADARLWMALAPGWTALLAGRCDYPQVGQGGAAELFERMAEAGLVERFQAGPQSDPNQPYYVMTAASRAEVLQGFLTQTAPRSTNQDASLLRRQTKQSAPPTDSSGAHHLVETLAVIGPAAHAACLKLPAAPREFQLWARLTAEVPKDLELLENKEKDLEMGSGYTFDDIVAVEFSQAIADREVARHIGTIQEWIETARPLAVLLEYANITRLSRSITKAGRQIELLQRRQFESNRLTSFYRRVQQIRVIKDFLDGPPELWALHLVGAGGVGKTMLIRYLTCTLNVIPGKGCQDEDLRAESETITARIDFDYLNPQYPRQDPGLLLWALGQELRLSDVGTVAAPYFDRADRKFNQLRQLLQAGGDPNQPALPWSTSHPLFKEGLSLFLEGLQRLKRPVILILDTCEELEKTSPERDPQQNVEETFRILRALHDGVQVLDEGKTSPTEGGYPGLRVILCGRRLLASKGGLVENKFAWESVDAEDDRRPESLLHPRPYLRLYELHGFSHAEAVEFLHQEGVPEKLIPAVIQASSPDASSEIHIRYTDQGWLSPEEGQRCNPYNLRLFLDWAKEPKPPTPREILSAARGRYIELRIIARLKDEDLREILPLAALLGHFDQDLLAAAAGITEQTAGTLYTLLLKQEWTTQHRAAGSGDEPRFILDIHRSIRDSLYAYFAERHELPEVERQRAAEVQKKFILDSPPSQLDWTDYDTALRLLQFDLETAAGWWQEVEDRLLANPDPQASLNTLTLLTGSDGSAALRSPDAPPGTPPENRLRPFVMAAQASLLFKTGQIDQLYRLWKEVIEITGRETDSPAYQRLRLRALAALLSTSSAEESYVSASAILNQSTIQDFWQALQLTTASGFNLALAPACLGAVEAILETSLSPGEIPPNIAQFLADSLYRALVDPADLAASTRPVPDPRLGLAAYACALAGSEAMLTLDAKTAETYFTIALELVSWLETRPDGVFLPSLQDWRPPDHLPSRIRLLYVQAGYPAWLTATAALESLPKRPEINPETIDGERLLAARLRLELAEGVPGHISVTVAYRDFRPGVCFAHRRELPYNLRGVEILATHDLAIDSLIKYFLSEISTGSRDLLALAQIQRAFLPFLVRFRLTDEGYQTQFNLPTVPDYDRYVNIRLYNALASPPPPGKEAVPFDSLFPLEGLDEVGAHLTWIGMAPSGPDDNTLSEFTRQRLVPLLHQLNAPQPSLQPDDPRPAAQGSPGAAGETRRINPTDGLSPAFSSAALVLDVIEGLVYLATTQVPVLQNIPLPDGEETARGVQQFLEQAQPDGAQIRIEFDPLAWSSDHPYQPEEALRLLLRSLALAQSASKILGTATGWDRQALFQACLDLAGRLGLRRAGEIAFQEAQLLALRLPYPALLLADWAARSYEESKDYCSAWIASVYHLNLLLRVVKAPRGLNQEEVLDLPEKTLFLARCEDCYRQIPEQQLTWEEIVKIAANPEPAALDALPAGFRPWLLRQMVAYNEVNGASQVGLFTWVESHYRLLPDLGTGLTLEWRDISAAHTAQTQGAGENETSGCAGQLKQSLPSFAIGCGVLLIGFIGGFFIFRWLMDRLFAPLFNKLNFQSASSYQGLSWPAQIALYIGALILLALVIFGISRLFPGLRKSWRVYWLGKGYLEVAVKPAHTPDAPPESLLEIDPPRQVSLSLTVYAPRLDLSTLRLYRLKARRPLQAAFELRPYAPYALSASQLPTELSAELKQWHALSGKGRKLRLDLKIEPALAAINWEAVLSLAAGYSPPDPIDFNLQRIPGGERAKDFSLNLIPAAGEKPEIVVYTSSSRAGSAAHEAWGRLPAGIDFKVYTPSAVQSRARIIHLWGAVEERFGLRSFYENLDQSAYGSQLETVSPGDTWSVDAFDLRARHPALALCILQGSILSELSPERMETERRDAALLRQYAADLLAQGVLVILLPPGDSAGAAAALTELAQVMGPALHGDPAAFHPAIHAIRAQIMAAASNPDAGLERALDVTIFIP